MSDLINRVDAIKEFIKLFGCIQDVSDIDEWEDVCQTTIHEIPSADAVEAIHDTEWVSLRRNEYEELLASTKVVQGEWKRVGHDIYECSLCHQNVMTRDIDCYAYCHRCGAKMNKGGDAK